MLQGTLTAEGYSAVKNMKAGVDSLKASLASWRGQLVDAGFSEAISIADAMSAAVAGPSHDLDILVAGLNDANISQ
jgi:hypothetical protein